MHKMIPYGRQEISEEDIEAVNDVLRSDFLTQGPLVEQFENAIARYCGAKYAVAVNSCTAALHIAYMALGIGKGKRVWTVPNTFVATANAALYCEAEIDFVDIDPHSFLMSVDCLKEKLEIAEKNGTLPHIVAPVHFSGQSCDMKEIKKLSDKYGFKIVEDAAHCIGASYNGKKIGSCEFSDMAAFSFHPVKIITTGEGGMVMTNSHDSYQLLSRFRTHGITRDPSVMINKDEGAYYFEQLDLGYHYRITDMQCALGLSQMKKLDSFVERRNYLAQRYTEKLKSFPVSVQKSDPDSYSSWHLFAITLDKGISRRDVFDDMRKKGIGVNVHYIPVHLHPYYKKIGFKQGDYPVSEDYYARAITLPLYPAMTEEQQDFICDTLKETLNKYA